MKGPYERLKYDLRRVWACPVCQHRERTGGEFTSWLCPCQATAEPAQRRYMTLVEDGCRRLIPREPMEFGEEWYAEIEVAASPLMDDEELPDSVIASLLVDEENPEEATADDGRATEDERAELEQMVGATEPLSQAAGDASRLTQTVDPTDAGIEETEAVRKVSSLADANSVALDSSNRVPLADGDAASDDATSGDATLGDATLGDATLGDATLGEQALGEQALGEQALGEQTLGEGTSSDGTGLKPTSSPRGKEPRRGRGRKSRRRRRGS